jgi:competence protein ComEC
MEGRRVVIVLIFGFLVATAGCASSITSDEGGTDLDETPGPTTVSDADGTLEVHFINVGQSVSTLIIGPTGETMLIDTGDFTDDGELVLQYLRGHDIDRIDHMIVTHNDADHIGGNAAIIEYFETEADGIGAIYDPGIAASTETYNEYLDAVEEHDVTLFETREGDSISLEGIDINVLGPPDPYLENEARNENSIVLQLQFGQTSFLFPGDAEDDQEAYLVEEYGSSLQSTVLKAGHHGSQSSSSGPFLDAVAPQAVIVSSAYDSRYDHPNEETLQRLASRSLTTYWTATHGNIVLVSDGEEVQVKTQRDAPTDPLSLREGDPLQPGTTADIQTRTILTGDTVTTPVVTDGGTQTSSPSEINTPASLAIDQINADAAGDDRENLNDEFIIIQNTGSEELDLTGWTVRDAADRTYNFPDGFSLSPNEAVTLHTGSGTDTATDLYWGSGSPIWNNDGDTIIITNSEGEEVLRESY